MERPCVGWEEVDDLRYLGTQIRYIKDQACHNQPNILMCDDIEQSLIKYPCKRKMNNADENLVSLIYSVLSTTREKLLRSTWVSCPLPPEPYVELFQHRSTMP
jgi:hypothetical protein